MGAAGFWDDSERAASVSAEHARITRRLDGFRSLSSDVEDLDGLVEMAGEDSSLAGRGRRADRLCRGAPGGARGAAALLRPLRRRRRPRHRQCGGRRHRCAGLGRDGAADADALGRRTWLSGRAAGGERGRGSGHQVVHLPCLRRERLRALRRRAWGAQAGQALAIRLRSPPPDQLRGGRGGAGRRRTRARSRSTTTICRSTPTAPPARAASTSTRPTPRCASPTAPRGIVVQCQNERSQSSNRATAMAMLRAKMLERKERERQEEIAKREGRGSGRQLRLADPLLRAASLHDGQGPPHLARDGRRAASSRRRPRRRSSAPTC